MEKIIKGKSFVLGNNVDTDQIIPAEHLVYSLSDENEAKYYGKYALSGTPISESGLPNGGIPFIKEGDFNSKFSVIIGGMNFGCGSSREHAPFALNKAEIKVIIAESYARIFYRNCVDGGFAVPFESELKLNDKISTGDELIVDLEANSVENRTSGEVFKLKPLGDILPIIEAGNIFEYAKISGMI